MELPTDVSASRLPASTLESVPGEKVAPGGRGDLGKVEVPDLAEVERLCDGERPIPIQAREIDADATFPQLPQSQRGLEGRDAPPAINTRVGHTFRDDAGIAMRAYLALGDSISIDDYTGVRGGGAASQLARKLGAELVDRTRDGNTTHGVLADLARAPAAADVVTLTAGGNDLLGGERPRAILRRLDQIAWRIQPLGARVVLNTIYDPSDGNNDVGRRDLDLSRLATIELRRRLNAVNRGIKRLADAHGFVLGDLERLFHGHGVASNEPWFVQLIEPNFAGATAIAEHWYELLTSR